MNKKAYLFWYRTTNTLHTFRIWADPYIKNEKGGDKLAEKIPDEATDAMKKMVDELEKTGRTYKIWGPIFHHDETKISVREWNKRSSDVRVDAESIMDVHVKAVDVSGKEKYKSMAPGNLYTFNADLSTWDYFVITGLGASDQRYAFGHIIPNP